MEIEINLDEEEIQGIAKEIDITLDNKQVKDFIYRFGSAVENLLYGEATHAIRWALREYRDEQIKESGIKQS